MKNRGNFTEEFCKDKLELIFGKNRVWSNIEIVDSHNNPKGEIDVLVIFADRAIIVQAKSKRLTLEARKGNDRILREDFKKSIQDSYDQGLSCSKLILNSDYKLIDKNLNELKVTRDFKEIYIFCAICDHYPALNFQSRQFLKYESNNVLLPPFIMDIFLLDVMTEMLNSPLKFLSYINRRTVYFEKILATNELTILSYHLMKNLWISANTYIILEDSISVDLDVAMLVRREGLPGADIPKGIFTKHKDTLFERLIADIETVENPAIIDFGFMLLKLSSDSIDQIIQAIITITNKAKKDSLHHDVSLIFNNREAGLTIHSNYEPLSIGLQILHEHCEIRKYSEKAENWFGVCINPEDRTINFGIELCYKWEQSYDLEERIAIMKQNNKGYYYKRKIGRNESCPCGSGRKYKKCCGSETDKQ